MVKTSKNYLKEDPRGQRQNAKSEEKKEINNKKYYELLGVDSKAKPEQIKKAFRKLAVVKHPDKGGDPEEVFLLI